MTATQGENDMLLRKNISNDKKHTVAEFINFIDLPQNSAKTFELIEGYIFMFAGNGTPNHQRVAGYIYRKIGNYLEGKQCEVFQDLNVYLFNDSMGKCENVYQPDILVNCDKSKATDRGIEGTPEFIVEVISKSTAKNDYFVKSKYYMEYGVREYWIVDQTKDQILVYINKGYSPLIHKYTFANKIKVNIFEDLYIDFKEILKIIN